MTYIACRKLPFGTATHYAVALRGELFENRIVLRGRPRGCEPCDRRCTAGRGAPRDPRATGATVAEAQALAARREGRPVPRAWGSHPCGSASRSDLSLINFESPVSGTSPAGNRRGRKRRRGLARRMRVLSLAQADFACRHELPRCPSGHCGCDGRRAIGVAVLPPRCRTTAGRVSCPAGGGRTRFENYPVVKRTRVARKGAAAEDRAGLAKSN